MDSVTGTGVIISLGFIALLAVFAPGRFVARTSTLATVCEKRH